MCLKRVFQEDFESMRKSKNFKNYSRESFSLYLIHLRAAKLMFKINNLLEVNI